MVSYPRRMDASHKGIAAKSSHIKELLSKVNTNKQTAKDEFTQIQLLLYLKI